MHVTRENFKDICCRYCERILLEKEQVAADVMAGKVSALVMMQRNWAVAKGGGYEAILLFISAAVIYFDSLLWLLYV